MAAYAALVSLMNTIEQIQSYTRLPIHFDQKQSESLLEKVNFLIDFLENYDYRGAGEEMKDLESRIRNAAYAAEDIIETHVVDTIHAQSPYKRKITYLDITKVMKDMDIIKKEAMKMKDMDFIKEEAMKMKDKKETEDPRSSNPTTGPSLSSVPAVKGFDDELKQITERLLSHQRSLQVIPIVGMGGMGKTTLAKTTYEKLFNGKHFDFFAWVTISQEYDLKRILLGLLQSESTQMSDQELGEKLRKTLSQMSDQELGEKLHKTLYGRRYLVVLDDMWSVKVWDMVKHFLPDNSNGSRIIVTTRESSVSTCFGSSIHEMRLLDEDQSWILFCDKVFVHESCPHELEEVGRKIVKNCKGLPLSIVVIGGLLAKSQRREEYWEYIARDTTKIINSADDERCMKIMSLSYHNLPVHLKPCFLYFAAFPEDEKIRASLLIKLWVAEGFLKLNSSKALEELAEEYLNDLINRNLIMVDERGRNGKIKTCRIHDLIRDICLQGAGNEKFMYAQKLCSHDEIQFIGSQRRISFHKSAYISQVLDTLKSGSKARTLIWNDAIKVLPLHNLRLMRVFSYTDPNWYSADKNLLKNAFQQLVNSRLISINIGPTTFPSTICLLWNLQILIVSRIYGEDIIVPLEIWEMTQLRHLQFDINIDLPDPPPSQQKQMKNLQTLKGIRNLRLSEEMVKRIPNIKKLKLKISNDAIEKELGYVGLTRLGLLNNLESFNFTCYDRPSYLTFPNSLKKLSLWRCGFHWEDMARISSISHLEVLILYFDAFKGPKWELDDEVLFPCLKYLHINYCYDLVEWIADDTHFPCLQELHLYGLFKLVEIPSGIGEIPTLQKIELKYCSKSTVISAKKILNEQEKLGNVILKVWVQCRKDAEIEIESESSLPIAVEIEGSENGQLVAKVISLEESQNTRSEESKECVSGPTIKESVVSLQLSGENDPSKSGVRSVFELDCVPLWGSVSIIGHRPEMEDTVFAAPDFMKIPIKMFISDHGITQTLTHLTSHFFGVYDGHGGLQVANYCRDRVHLALEEELNYVKDELVNESTIDSRQMQWEKVFSSCFLKVDDEVSGKIIRSINEGDSGNLSYSNEPVAPETVGSTAVVAVISSSHIIVANCGDSRAVIYRGKEAIALSTDHKPNREDEYARIEASGGKVIQWNGHRVCGVLPMSRSIGDRYLKPWIIPEPEVMFVPRARADECLVLASDGLWDVITNEEACEVARKRILIWHKKNGTNPLLVNRGEGVDHAAQAAAEYLANLALQRGSKNNISIIVLDLKAQRKFKNKS